jgi:WD40 repeat protein
VATIYLADGESVRSLEAPAQRPLRCAAWRPDGAVALLAGNRGEALLFDGQRFERLDTRTSHNLRGAAWSPDGSRALLAGNRGAVLMYEDGRFRELASPSHENLRRVDWSPDGSAALIIGNAGAVLRYDAAADALAPVPGDRAHTLRSVAWRPDGAYALIGAYASDFAGYPRPYALFRCDGRYTQAILATDVADDVVAVSWRPGAEPPVALALAVNYSDAGPATNKLFEYDGAGFRTRLLDVREPLLGAAWRPDGAFALLCGARGTLLRYDGTSVTASAAEIRDNLVGPFWRAGRDPLALLLRGPEKVYTA